MNQIYRMLKEDTRKALCNNDKRLAVDTLRRLHNLRLKKQLCFGELKMILELEYFLKEWKNEKG